jgi:estrone sulfotransferase
LKIGIKTIYPTDTFIVSYPKSGNTWVRFIIANMLTNDIVTMKNINDFVPGIYNFKDIINSMPEPRFIKSHHPNFDKFPKSIYIYRDYRDVLISYYHFQVNQHLFNGSISDFIKSNELKTFGSWKEHVTFAMKHHKQHPNNSLLIAYESLLSNPTLYIEKIATFCDIQSQKKSAEIAEICSFQSLQKNEKTYGKVFNNPELTFFRSGQSGQWKKELSENDLQLIVKENGSLLKELGYKI